MKEGEHSILFWGKKSTQLKNSMVRLAQETLGR